MNTLTRLAAALVQNPAILTIPCVAYVPVATLIRHRLRVVRLTRRGWRRNAMGEMTLDDDRDVITVAQLVASPWSKILDEHPALRARPGRERAATNRKGGTPT